MRWLFPIERYRIQCDVFQGMWLILCELCKRLEAFYKKNKVKRVVFRASLWQTQPKHKFKSFSRSVFHCSVFVYRTKHCLLFNNYIRFSCFDTSWSTALGVWLACVASVSNRVIARKLEGKQKKGWRGRGEEVPSFPSPSPVIHFFCSCPSFLAEPREETLATQASVWYVTSQSWLTYISLLGFWLSDKAFVLFDLLVLGVCLSDERLLLVFDNSRCLDIRWNTPPRVW